MPKCIVVLGPPGAGKSTQGVALARILPGAHFISVGALLRQASVIGDASGERIAEVIRVGGTVPSDLLGPVLEKAIHINQWADPMIIDFAGTVDQCNLLDKELGKYRYSITAAIFLQVPPNILKKRLFIRGREDDRTAPIAKRFLVYQQEISPVIEYYRNRDLFHLISGNDAQEVVTNRIVKILVTTPLKKDLPYE